MMLRQRRRNGGAACNEQDDPCESDHAANQTQHAGSFTEPEPADEKGDASPRNMRTNQVMSPKVPQKIDTLHAYFRSLPVVLIATLDSHQAGSLLWVVYVG